MRGSVVATPARPSLARNRTVPNLVTKHRDRDVDSAPASGATSPGLMETMSPGQAGAPPRQPHRRGYAGIRRDTAHFSNSGRMVLQVDGLGGKPPPRPASSSSAALLDVQGESRPGSRSRELPPLARETSSGELHRAQSAAWSPPDEKSQQAEVKEAMHAAMSSKDTAALRSAVAKAKRLSMKGELLAESEQTMKLLDVEEHIRCAMLVRETGALRLAIDAANRELERTPLVAEAQKLLHQLESERMLTTAMRTRDAGKLEDAINRATEAEADPELLHQAEFFLSQYRASSGSLSGSLLYDELEAAEAGPEAPAAAERDEVLLRMRRAAILNETGALKMAIKSAERAGGREEAVEQAKSILAGLETQKLLAAALRSKDRAKLQDAAGKAKGTPLEQSPECEQAAQLLAQFDARDSLSRAIKEKDAEKLPEAISDARSTGVEKPKIDKAVQVLAQLQAHQVLASALEDRDIDAVRSAVENARACGLEKRHLAEAEQLLRPEPTSLSRRLSSRRLSVASLATLATVATLS